MTSVRAYAAVEFWISPQGGREKKGKENQNSAPYEITPGTATVNPAHVAASRMKKIDGLKVLNTSYNLNFMFMI